MAATGEAMSRRKEERHDEVAKPGAGNTVVSQGEQQAPKARMPHEHDESADSQSTHDSSARRMGQIAHDDLVEGQQDTSKGPELDATYHRVRQGAGGAGRK
jgi:hypothetical protein